MDKKMNSMTLAKNSSKVIYLYKYSRTTTTNSLTTPLPLQLISYNVPLQRTSQGGRKDAERNFERLTYLREL